ncbi:MAG TPA: DUF1800 domain-containing protein [Chthoniobacterales bacterium]|nr:DUF1800 domain-containing protein [Chthoniobacterales bacterium]
MNMLTALPDSKWNDATAAHLLNRAAFGGTPDEIERTRQKGLTAAVRDFVDVKADAANVAPPAWAHPRNIRAQRMEIKAAKDRGENFQSKVREVRMMEGDEMIDLRRWWLDRMLNGPAPLLEKMTLFWHGHFATSIQKVRDAYWMWLQNDTLRRNALGNFGALAKKMSRDPAMMIYLDLQQSRQEHPNENWARELMELFTVGIGNYSEQDIRESARAFTGYRIDFTTQQFHFAPFQQDHQSKAFMGRNGNLNGDEIIDMLVSNPACAQFIGRKLWRFFVEDEPSSTVIDSVAGTVRKHNFEMRPVLHEIFSSGEFYSDRAMGSQIKSPVQYIVQTSKLLNAAAPPPLAAQNAMRQMGQILFAPPNVKGWDGGKQWISTSTLLFRYNFANYLINGDAILPPNLRQPRQGADVGFGRAAQYAEQIKRDPIDVGKLVPADLRAKSHEVVDLLAKRFFQTRPAQKEIDAFAQFLESRGPEITDANLRELIHLMMSTPQFQLA